MTALLARATAILDGELEVPVNPARAAAWLARSALEDRLRELIEAKGCNPSRAKTRTLLSCVESLYQDDPSIASTAQYAWDRLSEACHHHAYELSPTITEVRSLVEAVNALNVNAGS